MFYALFPFHHHSPFDIGQDLVVALSSISLLKVAAVAQVDLFLSVFLNTLATINANIIVDVGKGLVLPYCPIVHLTLCFVQNTSLGRQHFCQTWACPQRHCNWSG